MSFVREALSVAVLEALCPSAALAGTAPFPTTAAERVYLERVGALDDLAAEEPFPVVVVYTERDESTPGDGAGPPFRRGMDLVLDLSVLVRLGEGGEGEPSVVTVPATDRELYLALNVLEQQVRSALLSSAAGAHFRGLAQKIKSIISEPEREAEEGIKFAARRLTWSLQVPDDCFDAAPRTAPSGLARLPQPLRRIAEALMTTAYAADLAAALADASPVAPIATPFAGLSLAIDLHRDGATDIAATVDLTQD